MDFHQYYLRRLETKPDKAQALQSCAAMAIKLFEGPLPWAIESGAGFLCALHEYSNPDHADLLPAFETVEQALVAELQSVRLELEADREMAIQNTGCGRPRRRKRQDKKGGGRNV